MTVKKRSSLVKKPKLKINDKVIDFGQVYRVYKVEKRKNKKGEEERILHFKPYFKTTKNEGLTWSIPEKNLKMTQVRKPVTQKKLKEILKILANSPREKVVLNTAKAKETLNLNDPKRTAKIIRSLWLDKVDKEINFSVSKRNLFDLSIRRLAEEVAFVSKVSLKKGREKIKDQLEKIA